jgi:hypothetical protein
MIRHAWGPRLAAALAISVAACRGPKPIVMSRELRPPEAEGAPYRAVVVIRNQGGGEGEIAMIVRLRSRASGQTAAAREETVDLAPHETQEVTIELRPTAPAPYDLAVEARYPP